ncbi:glycosyltransferase family 2 protein [Lutibacter sp. TH_r2]|uniref:glycosyltransferase family 2 protein n=1 Tax=Lutibacter sp. TH_r2 TaxID=3082083 RepID=UPI002952F9E6|nr:glycosyltransferase family 2 protein [Lutibacter sp. TH_r2]MDV7187446.1 glycosyltransferase family 2 protein [Lutibacter sp. TH_r2]
MNKPLVSIIIPTYNRSNLIIETLESIYVQTYTNWECIIVDDGSTDNTNTLLENYCKKDSRFKFYVRPKKRNKGANACRNYGYEKSKGDFINWFDSDDIMMPSKLELQVIQLLKSPLYFTVCQTLVFEENRKNILGLRKKSIYSKDFFNDFISNDIKWLTQAPLIKRSFLLKNNLSFDETLSQSQERDFFIRVLDKVDNYLYDESPLVLFRKHSESISHSSFTKSKCDSNFRVNLRILVNHRSKLSEKSILTLKKALKSSIKQSVLMKEPKLTTKFLFIIFKKVNVFSFFDRLKILIGIYSIRYLKKGELFFS